MADNKSLKAELRTEDFGSAGARRLLRAKRIPAVIYGKNAPVHIILDSREFTNKMRHFSETALLKISVGKKTYECLMKDYQENLMIGEIKHVDFFEVTRG
ncbi:MAG TPA: 50S ribosomal protein L25, partial [Sphaerochaeta sp.]|nr:50S ribosomal protein L25 [Sphaerochaeta sp.]